MVRGIDWGLHNSCATSPNHHTYSYRDTQKQINGSYQLHVDQFFFFHGFSNLILSLLYVLEMWFWISMFWWPYFSHAHFCIEKTIFQGLMLWTCFQVKVLHAKASELQAKGDLVEALHYYQRCHWSSDICWWDGETSWKTYALLLRFLLSMGWTEVCWDKIQLIMLGVSWWAPETSLFNLFICNWCSRTSTAIILKWTILMVGVWLSGR